MIPASAATEIRALAAAGTPKSEIARRVGVDRKTISAHLRRVPPPPAAVAREASPRSPAPPAPRSPLAVGPSDAGRLAAEAFRLLDDGGGVATLVTSMQITPAEAQAIFREWAAAAFAGQQAASIRAHTQLRRRIQAAGLDFDDLTGMMDRIDAAEELLAQDGYTSAEALELMALTRALFGGFRATTHALRAVPRAQESRAKAEAAEERAVRAEARVAAAEVTHAALMGEIQKLLTHRAFLRLSRSLSTAVNGTQDGVEAIWEALADVGVGGAAPIVGAAADADREAAARVALANWAAVELPDLLLSRAEHEGALEAVRRRVVNEMLFTVAVAHASAR